MSVKRERLVASWVIAILLLIALGLWWSLPAEGQSSGGKKGSGSGAFTGGAGTGYQDAAEISAPAAPASGYDRLYFNTSHQLACLTPSSGNCLNIAASAGGTNTQIQYNSSGALAGMADFTFASHTISSGASGILDLHLASSLLIPGSLATGVLNVTTSTGALGVYNAGNTIPANFISTLNQNTTGSAASVSVSGQTGLLTFTGITSTNRAKTVRDAADTILELGGSYTPTGTWNWQSVTGTWPSFNQNTSGTAANLSGTPTLPNGTTGTTQSVADNTTKLATDAFVLANSVTNPMTTLGDDTYGGASGVMTRIAGPTAAGTYFKTEKPSGGAATAETYSLPGVVPNPQTGTTYTYLATDATTDRAGYTSFSNASSIAVTLPQAGSTGFGSNWVNVSCDIGAGTATITPTTSTISYTTGSAYTSAASSLALTTGQCAWIYSDNTNYFAIVRGAGSSGISGMTSGQVAVAGSSTTITSSKALLGTDTSLATATGSFSASNMACGDGNAGITPCTALPNGQTATTQSGADNSMKVATTAYVDGATDLKTTRTLAQSFGTPGGSAISTGVLGYIRWPYGCTGLSSWSITVDAGTATVKTWKIASGTAIPTTSNSISTSGVAISTGTNVTSSTVTDFTATTTTANDIFGIDLSAVSGVGYINFELVYTGCTQ